MGGVDVGFFGEAIEGLFEEGDRESGEGKGGFDRLVFTVFLKSEGEDLATFDVYYPIFRDAEGGVELFHFVEVGGEGCVGDFANEIRNTPLVEVDASFLFRFPDRSIISKIYNEIWGRSRLSCFLY